MERLDLSIDIEEALDEKTRLALLHYAKENNIGFGFAPEHPMYKKPERRYMYLGLYSIETDEDYYKLEAFLEGLNGAFTYGSDCYWFLIEGGTQ